MALDDNERGEVEQIIESQGADWGKDGVLGETSIEILVKSAMAERTFWSGVDSVGIGTSDPDGQEKSSPGVFSEDSDSYPPYVLTPKPADDSSDHFATYPGSKVEGEDKGDTCISMCDEEVDTLLLRASDRATVQKDGEGVVTSPRGNLVLEAGDLHERSGNHYASVEGTLRQQVGGAMRACTGGDYHLYTGGDYIVEVGGNTISLIGGDTYLANKQRTFNWGETRDYQYADSYSEAWGDDTDIRHGDSLSRQIGVSTSQQIGVNNEMYLGLKTCLNLSATFEASLAGGVTIDLGLLKFTFEGSLLTAKIGVTAFSFERDEGIKMKKRLLGIDSNDVVTEKDTLKLINQELVMVKGSLAFHRRMLRTISANLNLYS